MSADGVTSHYAIYRTEKITSMGNLAASASHMARMRPTPNADPSRRDRNSVLIGSADPKADVLALLPDEDSRTPNGRLRRRSNSVLAIEILMTASPDWWRSASQEQKRGWLDRSVEYLIETYGRENVAHLQLHQDETTPHLTGFIVPLDPDTGCLNARRWTGGRGRLGAQQTAYAACVEHLGLRRGVEGSPAKHERVKRFHGALQAPVADIQIDTPPRILLDPVKWAEEQASKLTPTAARAAATELATSEAKRAKAAQKAAEGKAKRTGEELERAKAVANQMRALELDRVLHELGIEKDPKEANKWKSEGFIITTKANKWYDHAASKGSSGAIDLVSHIMGTDFKSSLAWMASRFGADVTSHDLTAKMAERAKRQVAEAIRERDPFTPPPAEPDNWPKVRAYLINQRSLPEAYIDRLHVVGDLYADKRSNAVFVCRDDEGEITGAELKGIYKQADGSHFSGLAPGSRKELGGFRIGSIARAKAVYLVESAIDAISLMKLSVMAGERDLCVVSTASVTPEPRKWFAAFSEKIKRFCAFDNDEVGEKAARKIARYDFERLRPKAKDWNDDLKAALRDKTRGGTPPSTPNAGSADLEPDDPFSPPSP